ncbi:MAG TPA: hypothetical protein VN756_03810 [Solirubrobacterales bacterium]|nr:hypothetical protein [Solirubrobacterales bacterium]
MSRYTAVIRKSSGETYNTTVTTDGGASRAEEIAREIAASEDGEFVSIAEASDDTEAAEA